MGDGRVERLNDAGLPKTVLSVNSAETVDGSLRFSLS